MWIKVFSPNIESVEIVQRTEKRKRRARLYYMRFVPPILVFHLYRLAYFYFNTGNLSTTWVVWRILSATT
jgi:hypothetical protein